MSTSRVPCVVLASLLVLAVGPILAADHLDGWLDFAIVTGLELVEGPPYPTTSVETNVGLRRPPATSLPAGQLMLTLANAEDSSSGDSIAMMGSAIDNAHGSEAGDTLLMDMYFVPGAPPDDALPSLSRFEWVVSSDPGSDGRQFKFRADQTVAFLGPGQASTSVQGDIFEPNTVLLNDYGRMDFDFDVSPGQDLEFELLQASTSGAGGARQLHVVFDVRRLASDSVDLAEPLFRLSLTTAPLPDVPALPVQGIGVVAVAFLALGLFSLFRASPRKSAVV